jgi:hypothetical protein
MIGCLTLSFRVLFIGVQSGFFTMHTIVMMMKMDSYTALNGDPSVIKKTSAFEIRITTPYQGK